jgi:hypothetical protein
MRTIAAFTHRRPSDNRTQIDRQISDGKIYIASGVTSNEHRAMKKDWWQIGPVEK